MGSKSHLSSSKIMDYFNQDVLSNIGISLSSSQLSVFSIYCSELISWNQRFNLTAIREPQMIYTKHFLDSLSAHLVMSGSTIEKTIDIGSGAGFPGIPLKIIYPRMKLTIVESVKKKADFCNHIVKKLGLKDVEIVCSRAELIGQDGNYREKYDWAIARAVALMPILMEYLLPLTHIGGQVLAMKGNSGLAEAHQAENAISMLGGQLVQLRPVLLPRITEERYLVVVDKVAATHDKYPRRVGIPTKRPLQ